MNNWWFLTNKSNLVLTNQLYIFILVSYLRILYVLLWQPLDYDPSYPDPEMANFIKILIKFSVKLHQWLNVLIILYHIIEEIIILSHYLETSEY